MRGTLEVFPRLILVDFFENLGRLRPISFRQKNLKKIARKKIKYVLELSKFCCCISNRFCFLTHSKNLSKKNWGRPGSPAPFPKNVSKILGMEVNGLLKSTEFREPGSNCFWNIWLSNFWEFPLFQNRQNEFSPKNSRKKSQIRLLYYTKWFNLLWLAGIWDRLTSICSLEVLDRFGYI